MFEELFYALCFVLQESYFHTSPTSADALHNLPDMGMPAACLVLPAFPTTGIISPSSTTKLSPALSRTSINLLLPFHFGLSPSVDLPTPISLHTLGGFTPISTIFDHILSPRLSHLCIRASCSSSDGCHLLLRMRRMASGETLKCCDRTGVVNLEGCVL